MTYYMRLGHFAWVTGDVNNTMLCLASIQTPKHDVSDPVPELGVSME